MSLTPTIIKPDSGIIGLPEGVKEAGQRVDFKPDKFVLAIETKGYRVAWSRAAPCPCEPINAQTDQPDPNCELCEGSGWLYFAPSEPVTTTAGDLTVLQTKVVELFNAGVVRAVMSAGTSEKDPFGRQQNWLEGQMALTVRPENKIAYYDRIINLDSEMTFYEVREAGEDLLLKARYHIITINMLRSVSTVYVPETDYILEEGKILWLAGKQPTEGTRLLLHYQTFPVWLVQTHPHVIRGTIQKFKNPSPQTPQGDHQALPIQAMVKYEFLVGSAGKTGTAVED